MAPFFHVGRCADDGDGFGLKDGIKGIHGIHGNHSLKAIGNRLSATFIADRRLGKANMFLNNLSFPGLDFNPLLALSMERAAPYDAQRSALASGPGKNSEHYDANF
jgi:hypothetical protein